MGLPSFPPQWIASSIGCGVTPAFAELMGAGFNLACTTCGIVPTSRSCRLFAEVADFARFGGKLRLRLAT